MSRMQKTPRRAKLEDYAHYGAGQPDECFDKAGRTVVRTLTGSRESGESPSRL